jgi:hypothetical protein
MCLSTVSYRFKQPPLTKTIKAFKIFAKHYYGTSLRLPIMSNTPDMVENKWYSARNRVRSVSKKLKTKFQYVRGFHVLATLAAARKAKRTNFAGLSHVIREVKVRGVHTRGTQYGVPCLVANQLYIPSLDKVKRAKTSAKRRASGKR